MSNRTIPVVDLSKFVNGSEEDRNQFVADIGRAFHEVGFVGVVNHGIAKEIQTSKASGFALDDISDLCLLERSGIGIIG